MRESETCWVLPTPRPDHNIFHEIRLTDFAIVKMFINITEFRYILINIFGSPKIFRISVSTISSPALNM